MSPVFLRLRIGGKSPWQAGDLSERHKNQLYEGLLTPKPLKNQKILKILQPFEGVKGISYESA